MRPGLGQQRPAAQRLDVASFKAQRYAGLNAADFVLAGIHSSTHQCCVAPCAHAPYSLLAPSRTVTVDRPGHAVGAPLLGATLDPPPNLAANPHSGTGTPHSPIPTPPDPHCALPHLPPLRALVPPALLPCTSSLPPHTSASSWSRTSSRCATPPPPASAACWGPCYAAGTTAAARPAPSDCRSCRYAECGTAGNRKARRSVLSVAHRTLVARRHVPKC